MKFNYQENCNFEDVLRVNLLYHPKSIKNLVLMGALQFCKFHQYKEALLYLGRALKYDEKNIEARFWQALCFIDMGDLTSALKVLSNALQLDPHRADCLSFKAYILWEENTGLEKSASYLEEALKHAPFWPLLHVELISLYLKLGHLEKALKQVTVAFELLQVPPKIPQNEVEEYYEKRVTGRSWTHLAERLQYLQLQVENALNVSPSYLH